ncbi:MAG: lysoplasmalogenase [Anaerolineae bacterium]
MKSSPALSFATLASALVTIWAKAGNRSRWVYVFKPTTTLLIAAFALQAPADEPRHQALILLGLLFSLSGDVFLMLPKDRFLPGLISFLLAHLAYIAAFSAPQGLRFSIWWVIPALAYALILLWLLREGLGKTRLPVLAYTLIILSMAGQALERYTALGTHAALYACMGAALFVISDSALALNRFRGHYQAADAVVLGTYYAAQWLIALSI